MTFTCPLHLPAGFIMSITPLNIGFVHVQFVSRHTDVHHQLGDEPGQEHGPPVSGWRALHQAGGVETSATGEPWGRAEAGSLAARHQLVRYVGIHAHADPKCLLWIIVSTVEAFAEFLNRSAAKRWSNICVGFSQHFSSYQNLVELTKSIPDPATHCFTSHYQVSSQ